MTPLSLDSYFFPHVNVTADPHFNPDKESDKAPHFEIKVSVEEAPQNDVRQVVVDIYSAPETEDDHQAYTINLICIGLFKVAPDFPEPEKLLRISGAAMLYSAAREFLITITSRGPWGAITLPMASFLPGKQQDKDGGKEEGKTTKGKAPAKAKKVKKPRLKKIS